MPLRQTYFRTHHGFRRRYISVWSLECATTVRVLAKSFRSPPSTLYTCQPGCGLDWLGVASGLEGPGGSPNLAGFDGPVSCPPLNFSSPLRLPISPSGRRGSVTGREPSIDR